MRYDYLIVGPGLFGATFAHQARKAGKSCLVIDKFGQEVYDCPKTVISEEYSTEYAPGMEPYYPVNDERNNRLAEEYRKLAEQEEKVIFGGRLAQYRYYDMAPVIEQALMAARCEINCP